MHTKVHELLIIRDARAGGAKLVETSRRPFTKAPLPIFRTSPL